MYTDIMSVPTDLCTIIQLKVVDNVHKSIFSLIHKDVTVDNVVDNLSIKLLTLNLALHRVLK